MTKPIFIFLMFGLFLLSAKSFAGDKLIIQRLTQEIQFDGKPDERAWQMIDTLSMTMHAPVLKERQHKERL